MFILGTEQSEIWLHQVTTYSERWAVVRRGPVTTISDIHLLFIPIMLLHGQNTLALARRRADVATKAQAWNIRAFHSSQRCRKHYLNVNQQVWPSDFELLFGRPLHLLL